MQFIDKNIAILGLGEEGRDVLDWLKTNSEGCRIKVFDKVDSVNLDGFDIIFRSPGFWRLSPMLKKAEKVGALITSATKLFFDRCPAKIIGVTGTKGKGTTTTLIYEILKSGGRSAYIGGNIGKPMLALLPKLKPDDWVCLELSSFQLQDLLLSPQIAVVLNVGRDHLNVHKSLTEYRRAKESLVCRQRSGDYAVINRDYAATRRFSKLTRAKVIWYSRRNLDLDRTRVRLRGEHNLENIAAAQAVGKIAGIPRKVINETVYRFKGLEHRLELVKNAGGVSWYNDSFSTTPETAIAAIKSFFEPLTLILGGSEKNSDYRGLGRVIVESKNVENLILIGKTAPKIKAAAAGFKGRVITGLKNMEAVVRTAKAISRPGGAVVLSPACASFDMFSNYKDRGTQFKLWVKKL